jgi:hypothetical protein
MCEVCCCHEFHLTSNGSLTKFLLFGNTLLEIKNLGEGVPHRQSRNYQKGDK